MNTIPVKLVQTLGTRTSFEFLTQRLGISTYYESYKTKSGQVLSDLGESALALGGSVKGVTSKELTAAYCVFGNLGIYWKPTTYTKILDQQNKVVIEKESKGQRAISSETAFIMSKMLQTVTTNGTGSAARFGSWPIMSKTGTTSDNKDRWFVGGTPYYMAAVWYGMDSGETMSGLYKNPCIPVWKAVMQKIHKGLKLKDFPDCDTVEYRLYCTDSGMAANSGCKNTAYGWFKSNYHPSCTRHSGSELEPRNKPPRIGEKPTATKENPKITEEITTINSTTNEATTVQTTTQQATEETTVAGVTENTTVTTTKKPTTTQKTTEKLTQASSTIDDN